MLDEGCAGRVMQLRLVLHSYNKIAYENGWDILTDRGLAKELTRYGCQKFKIDLRSVSLRERKRCYGGMVAPTMIRFPEVLQ